MKSNGTAVILIDHGSGNYRSAKITANVFDHRFRITEIWFCIDIEVLFMLGVTFSFYHFERRSGPVFRLIEKNSTEGITEIVVVKVFDMAPEAVITVTAFGKETVDVRIPFEIPAKSMEDHDVAGSKIFGMVQVKKHP